MTFLSFSPFKLAATDIPKAADIELDACPAVKVSYLLSKGEGNPLSPLNFLLVKNLSLRSVRILWLYA